MEPIINDPVLLQEFLIESEELLQGADLDLVKLEATPADQELLNRVFRALHTIKGTAGFLGLDPVVQVGHRAEDVLSNLRRGQLTLTPRIMDALLAARDQLGKMLADIRSGGLKQYSLEALLTELEQVASSAAADGASEIGVPESNAALQQPEDAPQSSATAVPEEETAAVRPEQKNPVSRELTGQSMRVDVRKLDELVNLIGELVLERNRLLQLAKEIGTGRNDVRGADTPLSHSVARLSFITEELQAAGLRTRMVPIEAVFSKFPRLVRDLARSVEKDVELEIHGQETEIDKNMVDLIGDPLVHLVRNSLDHGIEMPDERERMHKPRRGTIRLEAKQEGDHIVISISDDGNGIDADRVLRKAIERGLVSRERAANLTRREIFDFIFLPGFSTVEKATNLSGRGVGMDVVRSNLKKLNGSVELESKLGEGTSIQLQLPLTLAILPVLLVTVGEETYALPLRSIIETSRFMPENLHRFEGREVFCLRNETLPLVRLQTMFSCRGEEVKSEDKKIVAMTVGDTRIALLVDGLIGQESTVVKPLGYSITKCQGIAGATVGGDGRVRLVLDPAGLLLSADVPAQEVLQ
ncbi:MAG TPA: chemotaxis protein CheA [Terriglobales bacterium]|nr:chemotaxis protein CheA [Terriglobales bacterium]